MSARRDLPTGVDNYISAVTNYYYVDKTEIIGDLLPAEGKVFLFTRPRRFGKTLTMSMLKTFFEISKEDTSVYFKDKKVWAMGERVTKEQGKYPVISMTLKGADCETWEETLRQIKILISDECKRHPELEFSDKVDCDDITMFKAMKSMTADDGDYRAALKLLQRMLHKHYGVSPIVLIDEYDVPIQAGYENGYYDSVKSFIKDFLTSGLKNNSNLSLGVLTGILRVSKESIFSDLNNLNVYSIQRRKGDEPDEKEMEESDRYKGETLPERIDPCFTSYFGFTLDEVKEMLRYYGYSRKIDEVVEWYDGYTFGDAEVFNPLSVLEYVKRGCVADSYWVGTSSNSIIGDILKCATEEAADKLAALVRGETIVCVVSENSTYLNINGDSDDAFALLLFSGYLKATRKLPKEKATDPDRYELAIANKEIKRVFAEEIMTKLQPGEDKSLLQKIWEDLEGKRAKSLEKNLGRYLLSCASYFDTKDETFYQGLVLGLCAYKSEKYYIRPNRESGDGRYDISLEPKDKSVLDVGVVIELKCLNKKNTKNISGEAKRALRQITKMRYDADLRDRGCKNIIKAGIASLGKDVAVAMR